MYLTSKNNEGKLLHYYLVDGSGDKNLPVTEIIKHATLGQSEEGNLILTFEVDYPELPFKGLVNFNLHNDKSQYKNLFLYRTNTIVLSPNEFMIVADFVWTTEDDTENFEIIGRFSGKVPGGLDYKICPTSK